ncbi:MAG TPA: TetR/AcrR family transcriptional regulator [Allosphingosinicella sp.]|nr:TetR/AcrR family transcriptional regulator [Allosphingosinicella sp.]
MRRQPGRPKGLPEGEMKKRILEAAADEFARVGFEGARIERVASAADCNRSLVYFYFGDKAGLFEAVLNEAAEHREQQMAAQPSSLAQGLIYWFGQNMAEPRRIRLIMQEALAPPLPTGLPQRRKQYLERQLRVVEAFQSAGLLRADLDARHLLTLFLAVTSFPACFPKVAAVSLAAEGEEQMLEKWSAALAELAALLQPPAPGGRR